METGVRSGATWEFSLQKVGGGIVGGIGRSRALAAAFARGSRDGRGHGYSPIVIDASLRPTAHERRLLRLRVVVWPDPPPLRRLHSGQRGSFSQISLSC